MIYDVAKWAAQYDTRYELKPSEAIDLKKAISSVFDLPKADRRFGSIIHYLPSHETEYSLHQLLTRWCHNEDDPRASPYGWVLDSPVDRLNLNDSSAYGFDTTAVLKLRVRQDPADAPDHREDSAQRGRHAARDRHGRGLGAAGRSADGPVHR